MKEVDALEIRVLTQLEEFTAAVELQREIWGFEEVDLLPRRLFVVASKIGGQLLGAFDGDQLIGFCLCIPGLKPGGRPYLHGHMLGVMPPYRNSGVGRRMKLEQRDYALANDINLIEWTFDPLEIKNAFFNMERLGAVVRRYTPNQYGYTSSPLHGGLPTDRLTAEWWVRSSRVESVLAGRGTGEASASGGGTEIAVPNSIDQMRKEQPLTARDVQTRIREQFDEAFRAGLAVTGFRKTAESGVYLLQQWESD